MWTRNVVWVAVVVGLVAGCGSEDEGDNPGGTGGGGAGGAGGAGGSAGMAGTSGGTSGAGGMGGTGGGGMGGAGGIDCPADPGITMCGTEACPPIGPLGMACYQVCCTADTMCGTKNAALGTECMATIESDPDCPSETIQGAMVMGCCVDEATNECGIINPLGFGAPCVGRTSGALMLIAPGLAPANCDGTPVMNMGGMGGMGGAGGMGGEGGMGGMGGMGGDTADAGL